MSKNFWKEQIEKKGKLCFLAPMDGYGDSAYRQTMKKVAPHIECITEFYSADGLVHSKMLADSVLPHTEIENPLIVQIFGKDPENFAKAAKIIEKYDVAGIDVNMGCPAKKVVKSGHGAGLLINECKAYEIIESLNKATKLPISVKTRLSFDGNQNLINFAKGLESAGASLITVHGRTAKQAYTGNANFEPIYELKNNLSIPVICNGDVENYEDGMKKVKNLDGFMIGRATFGNPWCFIKNGELIDHNGITRPGKFINGMYHPTLGEILEIAEFHAVKLVETKKEKKGCLEIRKHLVCYLKNFPGVKNYRKRLVTVETLEEVINVLNDIKIEFKTYLNSIPVEIPKENYI
nr:tRNA-dihydrouridine synthase family protein [Candidatus Gracilibacteria bacterium]